MRHEISLYIIEHCRNESNDLRGFGNKIDMTNEIS